jgi:glycosyltransferase involved in cell wall biosynthesis
MSDYNFVDFSKLNKEQVIVPESAKVILVSDYFIGEYSGGAELSNHSLLKSSPLDVFEMKSKHVTMELLQKYQNKFWVFSNIGELDINLIPSIAVNVEYSIIEYDFKFCKYRSPLKHKEAEGTPCDCPKSDFGKLMALYFNSARSLYFMSELQAEYVFQAFPFLRESGKWSVVSSLFDQEFFKKINLLNASNVEKNDKYLVLNSPSWIKGVQSSIEYCEKNNLDYELVFGLPYEQLLDKLAESKGLVSMPLDWDSCPRLTIEAKLLGCDVRTNENVLHRDEEWFNTDDINEISSYLYLGPQRFWNGVMHDINYVPTVSSYTTAFNCIKAGYPWEESISSVLPFSKEVVVVDGGSDDGTYEKLKEWEETEEKLKVYQNIVSWNTNESRVSDGQQKALARSLCESEFCFQIDADEVFHEDDYQKLLDIAKHMPKNIDVLCLPVVEYWGASGKIRADILPHKERLSRNNANITHGVPRPLRQFNDEGEMYVDWVKSDGCNLIDVNNFAVVPQASFFDGRAEELRQNNLQEYEKYVNWAVQNYPTVFHFSWYNLSRKIRSFRDYWQFQWAKTFNLSTEDTGENNIFFDKPWSDVSEEEIDECAKKLSDVGPRLAHQKINYEVDTSDHLIDLQKNPPKVSFDWLKKNNSLLK